MIMDIMRLKGQIIFLFGLDLDTAILMGVYYNKTHALQHLEQLQDITSA